MENRRLTLTAARGGNLTDLSHHNRLAIFSNIRRHGPVTKPKIAEATGLTAVTVTNVVRELESEGWVVRDGYAASSGGRRPVSYRIAAEAGTIIAVDAAGYQVDAAAIDLGGKILRRERTALNLERKTPTLAVIESITKMADEIGWNQIVGVGLAVPGIVEPSTGAVLHSVPLGWRDVPLRTIVENTFGWPAVVYNQTHAAVYGELDSAWSDDFECILYLHVGLGIGMGVVVDGRVHWGAHGMSGELGHTVVEPEGPECECGNRGCLERLASVRALVEYAREMGSDVSGDAAGLEALFSRAAAREGAERAALRKVCRYLSIALVNACHLFDPEFVLVSGPEEDREQVLVNFLRQELGRFTPLFAGGKIQMARVRLGQSARLIGAATGLLKSVFAAGRVLTRPE